MSGVLTPDEVDLRTELCGVRLRSPLLLGSGGLGESAESVRPFQEPAGAVVLRTVRSRVAPERAQFPVPHLALDRRRSWLLNCEWGNLRPLRYWLDGGLDAVQRRGPVIVSVSGRDAADCVETVVALESAGARIVELNFSCSHSGQAYGRILDDPRHVAGVVGRVKDVATAPIVAKLGWSAVLEEVAQAAHRAGADAIAVTNTIGPGLDIDTRTARPRLGIAGGYGGVSGRAIFPIALDCVRRVVESVEIPVVGVGGISTAEDVLKMLMVGARCVQIYTAALLGGPGVFAEVERGLRAALAARPASSVSEVTGLASPYLRRPSDTTLRTPHLDLDRCQPCGRCSRACPVDAITTVAGYPSVDAATCTGCGLCVDACPPRFDAISL